MNPQLSLEKKLLNLDKNSRFWRKSKFVNLNFLEAFSKNDMSAQNANKIQMGMVQLVRRHYPVPWYRVPCTMVHPLYHGTGYPVPQYRVTPNYARFLIANNENSVKIFFQVLDITNHDKFIKICFAVCFFISDNAGSI